jgi:outer membrane murein-binding lipoprotein Lpp
MRRTQTTLASAALLLTLLAGCVSRQGTISVDEARGLCPTPLTASQALRIADALDNLSPGSDLDALATQIERLDAGARICRGTD